MERTSNRGRPKGSRGGRGKGKRGRKPKVVVSDEETNQQEEATNKNPAESDETIEKAAEEAVVGHESEPMENAETDEMSNLDLETAPSSFTTTLQRNVPQIMLRLNWDHKVNLFSDKVLNPMIYCCDQCGKPILIYGRMLPCKHVFCFTCARTEAMAKQCPRCKEKVNRVEQATLGTVYMCTFDGERYGKTGCRRTYLSQRDLQAHINHRHITTPTTPNHLQDIKMTDKTNSTAVGAPPTQQQNSHLQRKDSVVISPPANMKQPYNNNLSAFSSSASQRMNDNSQQQQSSNSPMNNSHSSAANKLSSSHHTSTQDSHGYYNNQYGHQFNNGAGGSSSSSASGMQNNYYQSNYSNIGHYSQAPQHQSQQNWNQQYYR